MANFGSAQQIGRVRQYVNGRWTDGWGMVNSGSAIDRQGEDVIKKMDALLSAKGQGEAEAIQTLMNIGDAYENIVKEYKGDITDIIGKMNTDIDNAYTYMNEKYIPYVDEQKDYFAGAIEGTDRGALAAQYRAEAGGNVASQAASSEAAQRRQMVAQGLNPYANAGNQRALALSRNVSMAGALNEAGRKALADSNTYKQMDQQARATYADMLKSPMDVQLGIMQARGMPLQAMSDMMNIEATGRGLQADAAGKLLDYNLQNKQINAGLLGTQLGYYQAAGESQANVLRQNTSTSAALMPSRSSGGSVFASVDKNKQMANDLKVAQTAAAASAAKTSSSSSAKK